MTPRFSGTVETWVGETEATVTVPAEIPDHVEGKQCALCGEEAQTSQKSRMEWDDWLREHRDYLAITPLWIPLCLRCSCRVEMLYEGESHAHTSDLEEKIREERESILSELDLEVVVESDFKGAPWEPEE